MARKTIRNRVAAICRVEVRDHEALRHLLPTMFLGLDATDPSGGHQMKWPNKENICRMRSAEGSIGDSRGGKIAHY